MFILQVLVFKNRLEKGERVSPLGVGVKVTKFSAYDEEQRIQYPKGRINVPCS